jgi:hypothetical protein
MERFRGRASSTDRSTDRTPAESTAMGFSVKTCLPASTAAFRCAGRKCGGVVRITTSTSLSITLRYASKPTNCASGGTRTRCGSCSERRCRLPDSFSSNMSPIAVRTTP